MTKLMLLLMLLGSTADIASTEYCIHKGLHEANPIANKLGQPTMYAINIGVPIALYFALRHADYKYGKLATTIWLAPKVVLATRNFYLGVTVSWGGSGDK